MESSGDSARKGLSLITWTFMLILSIAAPVMERAEIIAEPVAESEHNPATCLPAHDHTLCSQVSTQLLATDPRDTCGVHSSILGLLLHPGTEPCIAQASQDANLSRAPPILA